ncbi:MAG: hypothetical protein A3H98_05440 [Bacteroidetes bacterium RIFCSPLOWO2_02_FULL_36_8]|nr:MAG: hypothetical protein A3H98_05440 [Bacteroidetes bacterium RIFCSPLOWO2_02_FULL_36_8]OFY70291.1 MAG: hypothetical protein A3G23_09150 [Bacteroidetes bacterium RIFCSPLOWO2_12_FULL_37_12]
MNTNKYYTESNRYFENGLELLKKSGKNGKYYLDSKYVSSACGVAYKGVIVALKGFLEYRGVKPPKNRGSIEYYHENIGKIDRKMLNALNAVYQILHLSGYYDGLTNIKVIQEGFEEAKFLINKIKPINGFVNN